MRHKNASWTLTEQPTFEGASLAVLMDIRDELQILNRVFSCFKFQNVPDKLDEIIKNTRKKRRVNPK